MGTSLSLTEAEEEAVLIPIEDWHKENHALLLSLVGRILSHRAVNFGALKQTLMNLIRPVCGMQVYKVSDERPLAAGEDPADVCLDWSPFHVTFMTFATPLKRVLKLRIDSGKEMLVRFSYERLPNFCYLCGLLGYTSQFCQLRFQDGFVDPGLAYPFGPWLRALPTSGRVGGWVDAKQYLGSLEYQSMPVRASSVSAGGAEELERWMRELQEAGRAVGRHGSSYPHQLRDEDEFGIFHGNSSGSTSPQASLSRSPLGLSSDGQINFAVDISNIEPRSSTGLLVGASLVDPSPNPSPQGSGAEECGYPHSSSSILAQFGSKLFCGDTPSPNLHSTESPPPILCLMFRFNL
ncbi:hypothetical protein Salat_2626700 [Sesamum alatum]|uniref:Zinc knuckle CX2CX4HX4C domain-containing protein n=1 Tax=Sesamum alatum TaxID=300844 RepID=A0AAE1XNI8_9LAMI|nr:hypothetical protein Salat_2626700 [Sesamum alatum]